MRVVLTQHLAHDSSRLLVRTIGQNAKVKHAIQYAAMHRLQAVANIRQCTAHNDRHRIIDVSRLHLIRDVDLNDLFSFSHGFIPASPEMPFCQFDFGFCGFGFLL